MSLSHEHFHGGYGYKRESISNYLRYMYQCNTVLFWITYFKFIYDLFGGIFL